MSDESQSDRDRDMAIVQSVVDALGEHFDSVQVFCTRHMPAEHDGTISVNLGSGNWHARFGQVNHWLIKEREIIRNEVRPQP